MYSSSTHLRLSLAEAVLAVVIRHSILVTVRVGGKLLLRVGVVGGGTVRTGEGGAG
jgi:hypothetical protein